MKRHFLWVAVFSLGLLSPLSHANPAASYYYNIEEAFTINFLRQSEQTARYLQIRVALRSNDPAITAHAETHLPMIQDRLRMLFSEQNLATLRTLEGRKQLQAAASTVINNIFETELNQSSLDTVYFTSFIWQ